MKLSRFALLTIFPLLSAAAPIAIIEGPASRKVGDTFILDAKKSLGNYKKWKVKITLDSVLGDLKAYYQKNADELREQGYEVTAPEEEAELFIAIEGETKLVLPTYPGLYEVTLAVSNADGIDLTEYVLRIGPLPPAPAPPGPDPIPDTISLLTMQQAVAAAVKAVVTPETHDEFIALADSYDKIASLIGLDVPQIKQTTDLFTAVTVVKGKLAWQTILNSIVNPRITAASLSTTAQYVATWKEIAAGIRTGAGAQPPPSPPSPPAPSDGLHVEIRYERDDFGKMPSSQIAIFTSTEIVKWLTDNCATDGYRIWDKDVDTQFETNIWKAASREPFDSLPWINISNGVTSFSGPLPNTIADTMALLKQYKP